MTSLVERIESLWWYWYAAKEGQEWDRFQSILADVRELQAAAKAFEVETLPEFHDDQLVNPRRVLCARDYRRLTAILKKIGAI